MCANLAGLTKAMRRDGGLTLESDFKDFTLGFTQGKASFDFVDVGHGKERADSKIKGSTGRRRGGRVEELLTRPCSIQRLRDGTSET